MTKAMTDARVLAMFERRRRGESLVSIGNAFGISRQRVHQLIGPVEPLPVIGEWPAGEWRCVCGRRGRATTDEEAIQQHTDRQRGRGKRNRCYSVPTLAMRREDSTNG